ncbi:MAG: sulfatase [Planctomycetota bacterium]
MSIRNVLFLAVDDLRPEINCFGKRKLVTPHLDGLAAGGVRFDRAYCQYPQCMPSRASVLSGKRPGPQWCGRADEILGPGQRSLPGHLRDSGVTTVSVGKVTHFNDDDDGAWTARWTDTFYEAPYACDGYCSGYQLIENQRLVRNFRRLLGGGAGTLQDRPPICERAEAPDDAYPDGMIAAHTTELLRQFAERGDRFLLAAGFYRPHLPWAVPGRYWDLYDRQDVDLADNPFFPADAVGYSNLVDFLHYGDETIAATYSDLGSYRDDDFPILDEAKQRECVHGYWASVSFVDAQIGRILAALDALELTDSTMVVLWGDNGWHLGEHKLWSKVTSFEESTRVPLLVRVPGAASGRECSCLVELLDLYPTLCDLLEVDAPDHVEGRSLRPVLEDPARPFKDAVFSRCGAARTIRTPGWRLTHYGPPGRGVLLWQGRGDTELFDLDADPRENVNLARRREYAETVRQLRRRLDAEVPAG